MTGPVAMSDAHALAGGTALVTGAGGAIGRAVAVALSGLGSAVYLVGRTADTLHETADELPGTAHVVPTDLTRTADVDALLAEVRKHSDRLDVLVHGAGAYGRGPLELAPIEELDRMYEANIRAPYRLTQRLLPLLKADRGQVVFLNSSQGLAASEAVGQYAATQHALKAVADSLRAEVNPYGIRVLTIHLGRTATERQRKVFHSEGRPYRPELLLQPADIAATVAHCVTLPSTAEVTNLMIRPVVKSY